MTALWDRELFLVMGKGGVGRSTVAASLALELARRGRKTLLYQANAKDRFGRFFGGAPVGPQIVQLAQNLHAVNTTPADAIREYALMVLRFQRVYRLVFENQIVRAFLRATPGLYDYALLGKAWFHATTDKRNDRYDCVVFDMPASGHCVSMLSIPKVIINSVPEGPLSRDARSIQSLLIDRRRTAAFLVTLAEEMPMAEARELKERLLLEVGLETDALIVNQFMAEPVRLPWASEVPPAMQELANYHQLQRRRAEMNAHYLRRIEDTIGPASTLPFLFTRNFGREQIETLSALLASATFAQTVGFSQPSP